MLFILFLFFFSYRQVKEHRAGGKIETMRMLNEKNLQKKNYSLKLGLGAEAFTNFFLFFFSLLNFELYRCDFLTKKNYFRWKKFKEICFLFYFVIKIMFLCLLCSSTSILFFKIINF